MRIAIAIVLAAVAWAGGCGDSAPITEVDPELVADSVPTVSDPVTGSASASISLTSFAPQAGDAGAEIVYVSLRPGVVPGGERAIMQRRGSTITVTAVIEDGGLNPVPIAAAEGDTVDVEAQVAGGASVRFAVRVPITRRPRVVRTYPPPKKRDVALNAAIVVVFTEPVAPATLTPSSVQLFKGASRVAGTVRVLEGATAAGVFEPSSHLDPNTDYRLVVTRGVSDLDGDALQAEEAVEFTTGTSLLEPAKNVTVLPDITALALGSQVQLTAIARDTNGTSIVGRPVTWSTDASAVATVSSTGLVTALAEGVAHVRAELDGRTGVGTILVSDSLTPVHSVEVSPNSTTVVPDGFVQLTAVLRDAAGNVLPFRTVNWESSAPAIATVSLGTGGTAVVVGASAGTATITATSEGKHGTATITIGTVGPYAQVSAGGRHSCALTIDGSAWCWGGASPFATAGELGNGTRSGTTVPGAVAGGLRFAEVRAAPWDFTCALTPGGAAYCWGSNHSGALGSGGPNDGPAAFQLTPVAVSGGHQYFAIGTGYHRACAVTSSGAVYCWGSNGFGSLGIGTTTGPEGCGTNRLPCSTAPAPVVGGLTFTAVAVGDSHTCALTATGVTYCWGRGDYGALGDGTKFDRSSPVLVANGPAFVALSAGAMHTCGLTTEGSAYCWGSNEFAQLGVGTTTGPESPCQSPVDSGRGVGHCSTIPVPVSGGLRFAAISAGGHHTCALTANGVAYCWGSNYSSQLGIGSMGSPSPSPVPVIGGLRFASISAGQGHSCGVTATGVTYCWGGNAVGQLGNGSTNESNVPVRVAGQP